MICVEKILDFDVIQTLAKGTYPDCIHVPLVVLLRPFLLLFLLPVLVLVPLLLILLLLFLMLMLVTIMSCLSSLLVSVDISGFMGPRSSRPRYSMPHISEPHKLLSRKLPAQRPFPSPLPPP